MAHQQVGAKTRPPPPLVNQPEVSPDLLHDQSGSVILEFLEYLFTALVVLNEAYLHMYPTPPQHPPCGHAPHQQGPSHLTAMAGQGERMAFVGMLLRSADRIRYLKVQSVKCGQDFASKMKELKRWRPEIAHGVAVLHFLTAGLCRNDAPTLTNLLHLVQAVSKSRNMCRQDHPPLQMHKFYREGSNNCTLALINTLLAQCRMCEGAECVKEEKAKLRSDLDPSCWHGCGDCESILMDIFMYANMLSVTNFRMLASTRLSLDYVIDLNQFRKNHRMIAQLDQVLGGIGRRLFNLGFTQITKLRQNVSGLKVTLSMDFEVMFISGWQEEKKDDLNCLLLEGFLQRKERRQFYIQCQHQLLKCDPQRKCCEPQMEINLYNATQALYHAHSQLAGVLPFLSVHMMLEESPCWTCGSECIPSIVAQMDQQRIPVQLVAMLPYSPNSVFLERLTEEGGPVQLKADLCPFEERHMCMVHGRCGHVRCHEHCHYSKPSKVLAVKKGTLRYHVLHAAEQVGKQRKK